MINKNPILLLTLATFLNINTFNSYAAQSKQKATIKKIKNQVEIKFDDNSWSKANINQEITPVTSIRTGPLSKAELMFSDGTITRIGSKAFFTFLDKQNRAVKVQFGNIWFNVKKKSQGLKIYSSNAVASITGTEGFVEFSGTIEEKDEIYVVKSGDTLNGVAKRLLSKTQEKISLEEFIEKILKLNPSVVKNKNLIYPGNKLVITKEIKINSKSDDYFAIGLIEGTSDVFKSDNKGEADGAAQKVKEGEALTLKGDKFEVKPLGDLLKIPKDMTIVKGGTFKMGDVNGESDEKLVHDVNVNSFFISKFEVTQADYKAVMNQNPSTFIGEKKPVDNVSWWDAIKYCNKKSISENLPVAYNELTGELLDAQGKVTKDITEVVGYRLPSESEWEYASKGGFKTENFTYSGSNTLSDVAWFGYESSDKTTHDVGTKKSNELGIFDMSGNVSEWVYDSYLSDAYNQIISNNSNTNNYFSFGNKGYRTYRGGSWDFLPMYQHVYTRSGTDPNHKDRNIGFRIAKNIIL